MIPASIFDRAAERAALLLGGEVAVLMCADTRYSCGAAVRGFGGAYTLFDDLEPEPLGVHPDRLFFELAESEVVGYRLEPDEGPTYGFQFFRGRDGAPFLYGWLGWSGGEGTDWPLVFVNV